jgi:hypothetical protein
MQEQQPCQREIAKPRSRREAKDDRCRGVGQGDRERTEEVGSAVLRREFTESIKERLQPACTS